MKKCKFCNKKLITQKTYCSRSCRNKGEGGKHIFVKCKICKKIIKVSEINYKKGRAKYCSYKCRGTGFYKESHENRKCVICKKYFIVYKKNKKTICSQKCLFELNRSDEVNKKRLKSMRKTFLKKYGVDSYYKTEEFKEKSKKTRLERYGNPNYVNIEKNRQTKLERYGNEMYNNPDKNKETCLERYGVPIIFMKKGCKSNGKTISNPQKTVYNYLKKKYKKSEIEWYLSDIDKSVDIYVPEKNLVVEVYGDFWHCNPIKYEENYYHPFIKKCAKEIWKKDKNREKSIKSKYNLIKIWENEVNNEKYKSFFKKN